MSPEPLPLAAASRNLRAHPPSPKYPGTPGRPRKPAPSPAATMHEAAVRLLDLADTAAYLAVSPWTVRDLEAAGTLRRVRIPLPRGELRKLLFDRVDLDRLIAAWKDTER